ncbi:MAG: DUF721 domain-containing protein [Candidatus Poribacteria bacterium]|nr:DUF721 domain-containing protein [Candidatus Poribacteria bacterium]
MLKKQLGQPTNQTLIIHQALQKVIDENGYGHKLMERRVLATWGQIQQIGMATKAVAFQNGVLEIHAQHSVWLSELHYQQRHLIQLLNQKLGRRLVTGLKVKVKPNMPPPSIGGVKTSKQPIIASNISPIEDNAVSVDRFSPLTLEEPESAYEERTSVAQNPAREQEAEAAVAIIQDPQCRETLKQLLLLGKGTASTRNPVEDRGEKI